MIYLVIGFMVGTVVMDFMWAWRLGLPQAMWRRLASRNDRRDATDDIDV